MTLPIDPLATLVAYLQADADLAALVSGDIFGGERPTPSAGAALTLRLNGGPAHPDLALTDVSVEVRCWGGVGADAPERAVGIWRAVHAALNVAHRELSGAHILWAVEDRGPTLLRDPDSDESFVRSTIRVATADEAVPS